MLIHKLLLENFRNYSLQNFSFDPSCNVIYGENAQGKTNLLEAIICLSTGKSHRTRSDKELIRFGERGFQIEGTLLTRNRDFLSSIKAETGRKKQITVNKVPV